MITNTQVAPVIERSLSLEIEKHDTQASPSSFERWIVQKPESERVACKIGKDDADNAAGVAFADRCDVVKASAKHDTQLQMDVKLDEEKEDRVAARAKNESLDVNDSTATATKNMDKATKNESIYLSTAQRKELHNLFQQTIWPTNKEVDEIAKRIAIGLRKVQMWFADERRKCRRNATHAAAQINKSADFAARKNLTPQLFDVTDRASIAGNLSPMFCDITSSVNHRCIHRVSSQYPVANSMIANAKPYLYSDLTAGHTGFSAVGLPYTTVCPASLPCETFFSHNVPLVGGIRKDTQKTEAMMAKPTEMKLPEDLKYQITSMPMFPQWQPIT